MTSPGQMHLWDICDMCNGPWLGRGHRHCFEALDRWFRSDNFDQWRSAEEA